MIPSCDYEAEYANLLSIFQQKVAALFSDSSNIVKRTLMEKAVARLCIFFGKQKGKNKVNFQFVFFIFKSSFNLSLV